MTLYTLNHLHPRDPDGGAINHRRCFDAFEVMSESRTHWTVGPDYRPRKVSKRAMRSPDRSWGPRQWYTEEQMEDEVWKRTHRTAIRSAVEMADTATLRQIHALLGLDQ